MTIQRGPLARMQRGDFNPNRHPRASDGRFVQAPRSQPAPLDLGGSTGSFSFPPTPQSADQVVDFWSRVDVPDSVLASTQAAADDRRRSIHEQLAEAWVEEHPYPSAPASAAKVEGWKEALRVSVAEQMDQVLGAPIPVHEIRPMVRATKMWEAAHALPPSERDRVLNTVVSTHELGQLTVESLVSRRRANELLPYMREA